MAIAFFDLDKTLLAKNSATLWVRYALRHGLLRRHDALQALAWLMRYRLGAVDFDVPLRRSIATLTGQPESLIRQQCDHFFHTEVRMLYRPGALVALAKHRDAGDYLVLLTSSTSYLAQAVSDDLQMQAPLCTYLQVDAKGLFTGLPVEPLCYGLGKLTQAQRLCKKMGISLEQSVFYSDAAADLPVFEAIGHPVAVNPDPRLRYHARKRRWPIVDWGRPKKIVTRHAPARSPTDQKPS